ncbi:hypothetical protein [Streptomyces sp. NPDC003710]
MIEESHIRELLGAGDDRTALVLIEGRAEVVDATARTEEPYRGAIVLITKGELVNRLDAGDSADADLRALAQTLNDATGKQGA